MFTNYIDIEKIRNVFEKDLVKLNIKLPTIIQPWGKITNDQGWEVIYSLGNDIEGKPCFSYATHHRMTGSCYSYIYSDGTTDSYDFGEYDSEMIRLCGAGDNWEFNDCCDIMPNENKPLLLFWENSSPFSQWHKCSFRAYGIQFCAAEQYMMYMKAILHKDNKIAQKIIATKDVRKQKELGRQVKNFNNRLWFANCRRIVYEANKYKFLQNEDLKQELLNTGNSYLVETSPNDKIWALAFLLQILNHKTLLYGKEQIG